MSKERKTNMPPEAVSESELKRGPEQEGGPEMDIGPEFLEKAQSEQSSERQQEASVIDSQADKIKEMVAERGGELASDESAEAEDISQKKETVIQEADEKSLKAVSGSGGDAPFNPIKGLDRIRLEQPVKEVKKTAAEPESQHIEATADLRAEEVEAGAEFAREDAIQAEANAAMGAYGELFESDASSLDSVEGVQRLLDMVGPAEASMRAWKSKLEEHIGRTGDVAQRYGLSKGERLAGLAEKEEETLAYLGDTRKKLEDRLAEIQSGEAASSERVRSDATFNEDEKPAEPVLAAERPAETLPVKDVDSGKVRIQGAPIGEAVAARVERDRAAAAKGDEAPAEAIAESMDGTIEATPDQIVEEYAIEEADADTPPDQIIELTQKKQTASVEVDSAYQAEIAQAEAEEAKKQETAETEAAKERERQRQALGEKGAEIARLTADLKKFEGFGKLRMLSSESRMEKQAMLEKLQSLKGEYSEMRGEVVGADLMAALSEQESQIERMRAAMESGGSRLDKLGRGFYDITKKMGEMNLGRLAEKAGKEPKSRLGKMLLRAASVRTGVGLLLLGGGLALGAATAGGAAALMAKRLLGGSAAGVGSYDLMKGISDRRADKFTDDELKDMELDEVQDRMAKIQARAAAGGKTISENPAYEQLRAKFVELADLDRLPENAGGDIDAEWESVSREQAQEMSIDEIAALADRKEQALESATEAVRRLNLENLMANADAKIEARMKKDARNDKIMKGVAVGLGALVGSGAMAKGIGWASEQTGVGGALRSARESLKGFLGIEGGGTAAGGVSAAEAPPAAAEPLPAETTAPESGPGAGPEAAPAAPAAAAAAETAPDSGAERLRQLAEIRQGDGYSHIIRRQLLADPERFGYNPATDGDVSRWARRTTGGIIREQGLISDSADTRLRFSANRPGGIVLERTADGRFGLTRVGNVREYVHRETPVDADEILRDSVEATRRGMGESVTAVEPTGPTNAVQETLQDQYGRSARSLIDQGVSRDELLRVARAPAIGGQEMSVKASDGSVINLGDGMEAKFKAMAALDRMDWDATDAKDTVSQVVGEQYGKGAQSLIDRGVSRAELLRVAQAPAIGGQDMFVKGPDGKMINVGDGMQAKFTAMAALDKMDLANSATPSEAVGFKPKVPDWVQDTGQETGRTVVETKVAGGGNEMLRKDWAKNLRGADFDRSMAMDSAEQDIRELAAHKRTFDDLVSQGKGNTPEAVRLAKDINNDIAFIKAQHGDILTDDASKAVKVPRLATAPETALETKAGAPVTEIKAGNATLRFNYGPDGSVESVVPQGKMSLKEVLAARGQLRDNMLQVIREHKGPIPPSLAQSVVEGRANAVYQMREGLKGLNEAGQGKSPAAEWLRKRIDLVIKQTEDKFGDVFK